jgi:hypothetical protein
MSASITNVINVALLAGGSLAARDNFNVVAVITSQQDGPLSSASRFAIYRDASSVAVAFGTASKMYDHATAFFGTSPNALNAGGYLIAGYWRAASETVAASAAVLQGAQIAPATVVAELQGISDGSLTLDVDGVTEALTTLSFQSITTMAEAVALIDAALTGATATFFDQRVVITSDTTGATSTITLAAATATGTDLGDILALATGTGAVATQGAASATLTAETKLEAASQLAALTNYKGAVFIDPPTDAEAEDLAAFAQASNLLMYDVFDTPTNLNIDPTNPVWAIKLAGLSNYRMLYSKAGNRKMATSYMARAHTVNFNAENSALTMHLKELSIPAEDYTETEIAAAKAVGLDIYTTIKLTPCLLTSGANKFTDERYNLLGYVDALQTDLFNLLKGTSTKIPQTLRGVNQEVDTAEKTSRGFVRAGVLAAGTWSSPDSFGDLDTFKRNIADNGFYVLSGRLADQQQSDRELRKSPVLQIAVKGAGAIQSINAIINFNA